MEPSNGLSHSLRSEYYRLESKLRSLDRRGGYEEAGQTAEQMIALVDANREFFDEPEDRIRILQARKLSMMIKARRFSGGEDLPDLYRQRAEWSTPSVCLGQACQRADVMECVKRRPSLSPRQQRMCVEKFTSICEALKREAAFAVRAFNVNEALEKRRNAVKIHGEVLKFDNTNQRRANQRYLEYWQFVTEHYSSLLRGNFPSSRQWVLKARGAGRDRGPRQWLPKARAAGRALDQRECFPNYFRDLREMASHELYIDAVERVKEGAFGEAAKLFQKWCDQFPDREGKRDLRFDNIRIFQMACAILDRLPREEVQRAEWEKITDFEDHASVARTTWALQSRLDWLRELTFKVRQEHQLHMITNLTSEYLTQEVNKVREQWSLFIPDTVLLGEDRVAGLRRQVNLLAFVDLFDHLNERNEDWRPLLVQNLKNFLMVMADYESKRYRTPPPDEESLPRDNPPTLPSEAMRIPELVELILQHLRHRSQRHEGYFKQVLSLLDEFTEAVNQNNCPKAMRALEKFFNEIRFKPHVIQVKGQSDIDRPVFFDEDSPNFLARETVALRLWSGEPCEITFEGPQDLKVDSYYYLRPLWNTRLQERRRIRHEQFLECDVPRWVNVFFEGVFKGDGKSPRDKFQKWILQFGEDERLLACQLYSMVKFYGEDEVRDMWLRLYREKLPPEAKTKNVAYFGLGHTAKSGHRTLYSFRQAISRLPAGERSFRDEDAFREISEFNEETIKRLSCVVFLDDFIGTGIQAQKYYLGPYFKKYQWLNDVQVYYCALVGFKDGVKALKEGLTGKVVDVLVSKELDERDRAFSDENPNWKSEEERTHAQRWAEDIGRQILIGRPKYQPERDKLGLRNSQGLVIFNYNVPSNTLPIFWGDGDRKGGKWVPLQERYD